MTEYNLEAAAHVVQLALTLAHLRTGAPVLIGAVRYSLIATPLKVATPIGLDVATGVRSP